YCSSLPEEFVEKVRAKTGLVVDAYFSATKIKWILDNVPEAKVLLKEGNLCVGTVDSYLIYKLTGNFYTDYTNASRTMLFNIHDLCWDRELLEYFDIPESILPKVASSTAIYGDFTFGRTKIPVAGDLGDQQAALFGQGCFSEGMGKITYGTGLFMLFNTGKTAPVSSCKMVTTIGYSVGDEITYALEGSVFNAGSAVQWLRDGLKLFSDSAESEKLATSVEDTGGVYVIPAFTGLGAPYWKGDATGLITGITRATTSAHITRAVLESMAYSAKDLADCMQKDSGFTLAEIRADGGASANGFLMQFQSDILGVPTVRPETVETTALGAAFAAGLAAGDW
ncbi:MAG: glycerol kinase, partial [Clostridia bacterium]|nr:glycerol kinase [Clostridia bacterium]